MDEVEPNPARARSRPFWIGDLVAAAVIVVGFWVPLMVSSTSPWPLLGGIALAALTVGAMLTRWRVPSTAPLVALMATGAGWVLQVSSDPMLAVAWCLYPLALRRGGRSRIIGGAAVIVMLLVSFTYGAPASVAGVDQRIIFAAVAIGAVWLLGRAEAKRLEVVRESASRQAAYERALHQASMAREVHDVVGHALSVISAEADVSRNLPNVSETELLQSLGDIEQRARGALEEVQALVRSLRDGDPGAASATPLAQLVTAAQVTGLDVDAQIDDADMPEATSLVVSRVVQEALSNVVRHARATHCEIAVWREGETVQVRIDDDGAGSRRAINRGWV